RKGRLMLRDTDTMTLLDLLAGADDSPALIAPQKTPLTYGVMRGNVQQLAGQLNRFGLGRGDRIAIAMPNGPELILTWFATAPAATAAPLNPNYKQEEFAFYFEDTSAKALITFPGTMDAAHAAATDDMTIIEVTPNTDGTIGFSVVKNGRDARPEEVAGPD